MSERKSKTGWVLLILVIVGAGAAWGWWRWRTPPAAKIEYRTAEVSRGDIVQTVTANGQLSSVITVDVGSQVSGNILKLHVDYNSKVTNGQLIAELDPATYEARLVQAESELANAQAQHTLARVNAKRAAELFRNQLIAESEHDQTMAQLEQAEAVLKIRQAAVQSAQVDLSRTKIRSPIDGTVISRNMNVGQTVQASFSAPTLFQIANDLTRMEIAAMVSEADIGGVEEGQEVAFTVEAFPSRTFEGRVAQVRNQPTTNQNVVNYATIISVHNSDLKLKPGMTATVTITTARKEGVLRVSNAALRFRPPAGAPLKTNAAPASPGDAKNPAGGTAASSGSDGLEFPGGFQPPPEVRQRLLQRYDKNGDGRLDEAERAAMQEARRSRGSGGFGGEGGGGGFGGGGGGGFRPRSEAASAFRTAYLVRTNHAAGRVIELDPVQVRVGITDGAFTEVEQGLKEGEVLAIGLVNPLPAAATPNNPFGGPFGGRPR